MTPWVPRFGAAPSSPFHTMSRISKSPKRFIQVVTKKPKLVTARFAIGRGLINALKPTVEEKLGVKNPPK